MNLAAILLGVARALPSHPAVTDGASTVLYGVFAERAARLAGGLRTRYGLQAGERVLLCMENCGQVLELLFACWHAGLCTVPVNAKLHPREVAHIAGDCGARLLFATAGVADALSGLPGELETLIAVVPVEDEGYRALAGADPIPLQPAAPGDDAWVFYTSGTTGRPKGARLSHASLLFMSHCYYADIDHLDERDTQLHAAPLSHGAGLYALPHMLRGGHQIVLKGFDPPEVLAAIERHRSVSLFGAPTMVTRLIAHPEAERADTRNLRTLVYGGGPMYVADVERALRLLGPKLYQLYGQGEAPMTITGLSKRHHAGAAHPGHLASCGVARTGVAFGIVDGEGRPLPPGEIGEIVTRSACVMSGYWGNPAASAAALRGGWLHTGDLGSVDEAGFLTLRDRSKDLIISGGSNIYPREIEEVLLRHEGVVECSVIGRPHPDWGEEVVAFVVGRPGAEVTSDMLDRLCLDNIARFKRPKAYRFLKTLPKNEYGKVLKTELRLGLDAEAAGTA